MFSTNIGSTGFGAKPAPQFGGLGGSTQQQQPSAFGSAASNTNPPSGGLFGSTSAASQPLGGLFGALAAKPSTGLFGSSNGQLSTAGAFGASNNTPQPSGGLFGNSNSLNSAQQPASGGLFGGTNNNQSQQGSGLFGASNSNQNQQRPGLFGGANNNQNQQGSGLFGASNNNQNQQGSGLFGASNNNQNQQGSGLFGASNNNQNQQGTQSSSGGLFNKPAVPSSTTGGLFGGQQNQNQGQNQSQPLLQGGGLFGSSNNQQQSGGLFGASNNQQQPQNQPQANPLFGSKNINSSQPSFAWTPANQAPAAGAANTEQNAANSAPQYNLNNTYTPAINDQLTKIKQQWDPSSPLCALKTHLYNKLGDAEIAQLLAQPRPSDETPEDWDKALHDRPTANHYPVKVTSFSQVAQRIETELEYVAKSRAILNNLNDRIQLVASKHDLDTTARISKARLKHVNLSRRLLRLATVLAVIKLKGYPLLPEEEELSRQFNVLSARLNDPNSPLGKLNDVFARLAILKQRANDLHSQLDGVVTRLTDSADFKTELPNDGDAHSDQIVQRLTKVLAQQQVGLVYLNNVLQKDVATVTKLETSIDL